MLFTSGLFLFLFLPVALAGFFLIARLGGAAAGTAWLVIMSVVFYGYWVPQFLLLLIGSIALNYLGGLLIIRSRSRSNGRQVTALFVTIDLLLLFYFKYYGFAANSVQALGLHLPALHVVLPIGISFFTFTQIAYLVDCYKQKAREVIPTQYALFVSYFPHLIAGPILHHSEMMPQFAAKATYQPRVRNFAVGLSFLLIGLVKKVLVADSISGIADATFAAASTGAVGVLHAWEGALAYALQIYYDFSGYSDMAIGISWFFGISLPFNFNSPYRSTYLYISLGGNRHGDVRRYINLFTTMLLGGLWHGAAWTFVIWGAMHGSYLLVAHGWSRARGGRPAPSGPASQVAGWMLTMLAVVLAWVFFRATSVTQALTVLSAMGGVASHGDLLAGRPLHWAVLAPLALVAALLPNSQQLVGGSVQPMLDRSLAGSGDRVMILLGVGLTLVVGLAVIAASRADSPFIYFNF